MEALARRLLIKGWASRPARPGEPCGSAPRLETEGSGTTQTDRSACAISEFSRLVRRNRRHAVELARPRRKVDRCLELHHGGVATKPACGRTGGFGGARESRADASAPVPGWSPVGTWTASVDLEGSRVSAVRDGLLECLRRCGSTTASLRRSNSGGTECPSAERRPSLPAGAGVIRRAGGSEKRSLFSRKSTNHQCVDYQWYQKTGEMAELSFILG